MHMQQRPLIITSSKQECIQVKWKISNKNWLHTKKTSKKLSRLKQQINNIQGVPKKTDTQFYFCDNFGNSAPISTILSLLQAEIYGA